MSRRVIPDIEVTVIVCFVPMMLCTPIHLVCSSYDAASCLGESVIVDMYLGPRPTY